MTELIALKFACIILFGIAAQWLSWRIRIPSIIVLLGAGFIAGPVTGFIVPQELLGDLLFPVVSLLVSIIVFEGGMSLRFEDFKQSAKEIGNLIVIGSILTLGMIAMASYYVLELPLEIAVLFGSMMVITGPTVIVPLLRHVSLRRELASLLRWEGILIAPVGTILIVLVYQFYFSEAAHTTAIILTLIKTIGVGGALGIAGAFVVLFMMKNDWAPDYLQEVITLVLVLSTYTASNLIQGGSGLVAVVGMGMLLSNQQQVVVRHIAVFKENLRILAISTLFILLSAELSIPELMSILNMKGLIFLLLLIFVVRPVSVFIATIGLNLSWKEKCFISWMAPRGIVTASIAFLFALQLVEQGYDIAHEIVPLTFMVIITTVILYGLTAGPFQRLLGLSLGDKTGLLIVGANSFSIEFAKALKNLGRFVLMVDTNRNHIMLAKSQGLRAIHRNIFSDNIQDNLEINGVATVLALTSSEEINMLANIQWSDSLGKDQTYRLQPNQKMEVNEGLKHHDMGALLFNKHANYSYLATRMHSGSTIQCIGIDSIETVQALKTEHGERFIPLAILDKDGQLRFVEVGKDPEFAAGDQVLALI